MAYRALYREFRPDSFDKIIGQEHIVRTLINQIKTNRVGHAYLFCGARGTGKTTAAKVFARAINCLTPVDGSPCGKCEVCKKLENPTNLDILEMDAASNNKVENVRELRDKIQYPPVAGKYKVYIIDEVHMLTTEAFNALLKTLEEPPSHAVFILATTEVHKIPATILSRCLRFDFKLIKTSEIAKHIGKIYDKIGKKYQKEAVNLIAKAGEGSVRDALSIADICLSYSDGELTYDQVLDVLGSSDRGKTELLIKHMFHSETGEMLSVIDELCGKGKSISILNKDVCSVLRDLLVCKTCKNSADILGLPEDKLKEFKNLAEDMEVPSILRAIEIFSQAEADLKYSTNPKIIFETSAVKASLPKIDYNIDALMARVNKLENLIESGNITVSSSNVKKPSKIEEKADEKHEKPVYNAVNSTLNSGFEENVKVEQKPVENVETKASSAVSKNDEKPLKNKEIKEEKQQKRIISPEIDEDLASLMEMGAPMEEDNGMISEVPSSSAEKAKKPAYKAIIDGFGKENSEREEKQEIQQPKATKNEEKSSSNLPSNMDATLVWGKVLKKLRKEKEIMLWVACQDVSANLKGSTLVVVAPGENEYSLLSKLENIEKLNECVKESGLSNVVVVKDKEEEIKEENNEKAEKLKEIFKGERFEVVD